MVTIQIVENDTFGSQRVKCLRWETSQLSESERRVQKARLNQHQPSALLKLLGDFREENFQIVVTA